MKPVALYGPFKHLGDCAWSAELPAPPPEPSRTGTAPALFLYENNKRFGQRNSGEPAIREQGRGRYIYGQRELIFSTPDNTDPNTNGRAYSAVWLDKEFLRDRFRYFQSYITSLFDHCALGLGELSGKTILEIGASGHWGASFLLCGLGARVAALEPRGEGWRADFHPAFIDVICEQGEAHYPQFNSEGLRRCVEENRLVPEHILCLDETVETLPTDWDGAFDITASVSTLEHVHNVPLALARLAAVTKAGGVGAHHIDFCDHRDARRPLEFLLLSNDEFEAAAGSYKYEIGNRCRPAELQELCLRAGFPSVREVAKGLISEAYLDEVLPRLRGSQSRFSQEGRESVQKAYGVYLMKK
ncbi:MAG: class I SAM-dependent methyltransferase [Pseudomonadota bacterium]|nr:class I SAM-dependent methyltransferase [Pseudomonadota bacterium]